MKHIFFLLFFLFSISSFSQTSKSKVPRKTAKSVTELTYFLTEDIRSKEGKVEAIYKWITENIAYDYAALEKGAITFLPDTKVILKSRKALNSGYAELMKAMLDVIEIENETVSGYMHDMHWFPGKPVTEIGHSWMAIKIDTKWQLADPTWDAGYIGRIPKNVRPYKEKKYLKNSWKNPDKEAKAIEKREKKELDRKKKYDDKPGYTNKIGFVSDPTMEFFLIHQDTFLMRHAPTLPMWQLRKSAITLDSYSKAEDSLLMDIENNVGINVTYYKEIENFKELDFLQQLLYHGEEGYKYNPKNPWVKALYYYDFMAIIHSKTLQKLARGSVYEINESKYNALAAFSDTILNYNKLYKTFEKETYGGDKLYDKEQYKLSASRDKENAKLIKQLANETEKTTDKIKSNSSTLEKNLERLNTLKGKMEKDYAKSVDYNLPDDLDTNLILANIRSIRNQVKKMDSRIAQLDAFRSNSSFNRLFSGTEYINQMLLYNEHYIRVNSYSTAEWVAETDSIIKSEANLTLKVIQDSIKLEILEKELMDNLKAIEDICKVAKTELNANSKIKYPYKYELYLQAMYANAIRKAEEAHMKSLNFNSEVYKALKSERGTTNQVESRMKKQPDLKEKNYDYIAKLSEKEHERKVNYMELINREAKKWKVKYSGK